MSNIHEYERSKAIESDIFIPKAEAQQYLDEHGIELRYLDNGTFLAGATRLVEDETSTHIEFTFPSGAYFEPAGKSGINHFIEHLLSNRPGKSAKRNEIHYNAQTSTRDVEFSLHGTANPTVLSYGVWPVIPEILKQFSEPLHPSEEELESEKGVVVGEMHEYEYSHGAMASEFLRKVIYSPSNPSNYRVLGFAKDVLSLSSKDIEQQFEEIIIPNGLVATVFSEGRPEITSLALDGLERELSQLASEKSPKKIPFSLYESSNENYKQGSIYSHHTGLSNRMISLDYIWMMPAEHFTVEDFAMTEFFRVAEQSMFSLFREMGLGYSMSALNIYMGMQRRVLGFQLNIASRSTAEDFAQNLYQTIQEKVFGINPDSYAHINTMIHRRLEALPKTARSRFGDVMYGLEHYNKIIDSNKISEISKKVSIESLQNAQEYFLSTDPTVVVVGDLK